MEPNELREKESPMTRQPGNKHATGKKTVSTKRAIRDLDAKTRDIRGGQASIDRFAFPFGKP